MTRYSVQPRIFVKSYGFLSFAKNMGKNIGKKLSKSLSGKKVLVCQLCVKNFLIMLKNQQKTQNSSKRVIQKTAEATGDLTGNKIANKITKFSKKSQQYNSETVTNEHDKEISKEKCVSPEGWQEMIDELRLEQYNNGISKNHKSFKKFTTK